MWQPCELLYTCYLLTYLLRYPHPQLGRLQLSIDICCTRPSSTANPPHGAAAVDRRSRQTDGRTDTRPLHRPRRHAPHIVQTVSIRQACTVYHAINDTISAWLNNCYAPTVMHIIWMIAEIFNKIEKSPVGASARPGKVFAFGRIYSPS